jgi:hypothetical protein
MPKHLKIIISIIAIAAGALMFWLDTRAGAGGAARWVALALGPFATFAIWVFPEASAKEIRKEAAERRQG